MTRPSEVAPHTQEHFPPAAAGGSSTPPQSESATAVMRQILETAARLREFDPQAVPLACWDFDGTLLEGDCVDGLCRADGDGYMGLVERAIRQGLCPAFAGADGVAQCERAFREAWRRDGRAAAYAFQSLAFAGAAEAPLRALAADSFAAEMDGWFFDEARTCWHQLEAAGVECWVLSASPEFFVQAAADCLQIPMARCLGMTVCRTPEGRLGDRLASPVMFGEGKTQRLRSLLAEYAATHPGRTPYPIAAFGNDPISDGPMIDCVRLSALPAGQALGIYINVQPSGSAPATAHLQFAPRPRSTRPGA